MSRRSLVNRPVSGRRPADRLLMLLKTRGPQTSSSLGRVLKTTDEAVRQQMARLAEDGLVEATSEARGVGRPVQVWQLTPAGHLRFPDTHAELTVQLIDSVRAVLGEPALNRLVSAREKSARTGYAAALHGVKNPEERVSRLAELRSREGYMAEWRADGEGFLLIENHCPICAAAAACTGFCRSELSLFRKILGPDFAVNRVEHILEGARRCVYRISPAASKSSRQPR